MKLQKFENVDVIASLEAIMKQNTAFYQSDFDIDKQILQKAAVSPIPEDRRLLWFSRPSGTCCSGNGTFSKGTQGSIIHGGFTGNRPAILSLPMRWN